MKALVVDDDVDLLDLVTYALRREGFTVTPAIDGAQALHHWQAENPDSILLDANLPKRNGFEVCRRIRHESHTPIIMLTARDDEEDVVRGLQLGADDYVTKPFSAKQLIARMKAVLRRVQTDPYTQANLSPLEFRILFMLAMNANRVIPYSRLVEYAWGYDSGDANLLKTHVCHIREKLTLPMTGKNGIRAVPGVGYKLVM